jgi:hypothetical protein
MAGQTEKQRPEKLFGICQIMRRLTMRLSGCVSSRRSKRDLRQSEAGRLAPHDDVKKQFQRVTRVLWTEQAHDGLLNTQNLISRDSSGETAAKGCCPVASSYSTTPSENTSDAVVTGLPRACCGDM